MSARWSAAKLKRNCISVKMMARRNYKLGGEAAVPLLMQHHPVFRSFPTYSGPVEAGYCAHDFLGIKTRAEFLGLPPEPARHVETGYPPLDEEYFEWIDLLESVAAAKGTYTMMELGAGYGRWAVRGAIAIRLYRQIPFRLVVVEAEPRHFKWIERHMSENGIDPREHTLLRAAVGDRAGTKMFYVGQPDGGDDQAAAWYGQALIQSHEIVDKAAGVDYEGYDVLKLKSGYQAIKTECLLLGDIMKDADRIDLIDMDLQGEELKVVASTIDDLDRKALRLHIGTHQPAIEACLRKLLNKHGWECRADYACLEEHETPWGLVKFQDGVQSWINPRLA